MIKIDQIIHTKRKSIAIIIQRDGSITVRAPLRASDRTIRAFVEKNADWIRSKQALVKTDYPLAAPKKYANGENFWFMGKQYPLEIIDKGKPSLQLLDERFYLDKMALPIAQSYFAHWYKIQAQRIIPQRVKVIAAVNGFIYHQVKITSARTRWGSCSSKGSLCFSWRLIMAPPAVIDYVVIHELVHLEEKNHGKAFWAKVNALMPDYKQKIAWLKKNGQRLNV